MVGLNIAKRQTTVIACVKPCFVPLARKELDETDVLVCPVIGSPHGNSTTAIIVLEAEEVVRTGEREVDMVIKIGQALGGQWSCVEVEVRKINEAVVKHDATSNIIFEDDYLTGQHIIWLCQICSDIGVASVKTYARYGFVKQQNGVYSYKGAAIPQPDLMRQESKAFKPITGSSVGYWERLTSQKFPEAFQRP